MTTGVYRATPVAVGDNQDVDLLTDAYGRLQTTATATPVVSPTATVTAVADSASSVMLLAANAVRTGASIFNDSSAALYVKLGTTASTTSYTARLAQYGYYEVPYGYTGRIDGIWSTDPGDGAARITEYT